MEDLKKSFLVRGGNIVGAVGDKNFSTAPLGTVLSFAGQIAPHGYLLCDGASYKVADYPHLYAVIGNTYGGDSTNFNVPNLVDKFIQGSTASGTEKEAGLPNIEGKFGQFRLANTSASVDGAFRFDQGAERSIASASTTGTQVDDTFSFDASRSNAIYGNSDTVQPPALTMVYIIKAFHTNEGTDSNDVTDQIVEYVEGEIAEVDEKINGLISDTSSETSTYSSAKIDTELAKKLSKNYNLSLTDANTVIDSGNGLYMYRVGSGCLNIPVNRIGIIISNNYSDTQYKRITQTYMTNDDDAVNGLIYMRYGMSNNSGSTYTWSDWKQISYLNDSSTGNAYSTWSSSKIASTMPTTRSLTLQSGYSGYITEVYDPTTKVVVYNVNIEGTFKGLGNSIATGFKVPKDAVSSDDVMHTTWGIFASSSGATMIGTAQFTRMIIRYYGNPFLDVDANGTYRISGTITYVTA